MADYYTLAAHSDSRFADTYAGMAGLFRRLGSFGSGAGENGGKASRTGTSKGTSKGTGQGAGKGAGPSFVLPYHLPYHATLLPTGRRAGAGADVTPVPTPSSLLPYVRGRAAEDGALACEFTDPTEFVTAVLTTRPAYRIEWPGWLRTRLAGRLEEIARLQFGVTLCVTPTLVSSGRGTAAGRNGPTVAAAAEGAQPEAAQGARRPQTGRNEPMTELPARFTCAWNSYVGAVHGALTAAGLTERDFTDLMGLTGMAFHLIMHEECCPSSVTMYPWTEEHLTALDRIGVLSEAWTVMPDSVTYEAARRRATLNIKASLDSGLPVILWGVDTAEFGVVHGYDDGDGVFLVDGCWRMGTRGTPSNPILYENVGRSCHVPILFYQNPVERVAFDEGRAYRESLLYYAQHMSSPAHFGPAYKGGLSAYDNWLRALEGGKFIPFGVRYNGTVYAESKDAAAAYVARLAENWDPALRPTAKTFAQVAAVYAEMMRVLGHSPAEGKVDLGAPVTDRQVADLTPLVRQAKLLEGTAVRQVQEFLAKERA